MRRFVVVPTAMTAVVIVIVIVMILGVRLRLKKARVNVWLHNTMSLLPPSTNSNTSLRTDDSVS